MGIPPSGERKCANSYENQRPHLRNAFLRAGAAGQIADLPESREISFFYVGAGLTLSLWTVIIKPNRN
jgi:hypothetical protein